MCKCTPEVDIEYCWKVNCKPLLAPTVTDDFMTVTLPDIHHVQVDSNGLLKLCVCQCCNTPEKILETVQRLNGLGVSIMYRGDDGLIHEWKP